MKQVLNAVNVRDKETKQFKSLPALMGPSAYDIAKSKGGYSGSEEEFAKLQAAFAESYDRAIMSDEEEYEEELGLIPRNADRLGGKTIDEIVLKEDALTLEEIEASTILTGKIASAQAVRVLNDKLSLKQDKIVEVTKTIRFIHGYGQDDLGLNLPISLKSGDYMLKTSYLHPDKKTFTPIIFDDYTGVLSLTFYCIPMN